jgi:hypothetical protein
LKESKHFTDFALDKATKEHEGRNLTREILKNVLPLANLIKSDIEKNQFVKKIALKMRVGEDAVWEDLKKVNKKQDFAITEISNNNKDEKEALMFEAERYGLKIDLKKTNEDILKKIELQKLKQKLQEITITLDDKDISKTEETKQKAELEKIQKHIKELNN